MSVAVRPPIEPGGSEHSRLTDEDRSGVRVGTRWKPAPRTPAGKVLASGRSARYDAQNPASARESLLTEGGLRPALRMLARRSAVPVELHIGTDSRYPPPVEVAAYCVVS